MSKIIPPFMYGTAWKEDDTACLVELALQCGFKAIDTANQRKHYHEVGVGEGLKAAYEAGLVQRSDLFLQSKYTFARGQDARKPYDEHAGIATQVAQSFASSLEHLHTETLDSYILHGPTLLRGLIDEDWQAWHAMEALQQSGQTTFIGISNVNLQQLEALCQHCNVKPKFVQNRTFARMGWDRDVRAFCKANDIIYQGFSLLTANLQELNQQPMHQLAAKHQATIPQIVFKFAEKVGMLPLTGTSKKQHMLEDLQAHACELSDAEVNYIESIAG